jgi:ATP-dependent DNA helicase RecG
MMDKALRMERYRQRSLFEADTALARVKNEDQWFDRKSSRIRPKDLAEDLVGFANADGGTIVVGLEDDGRATTQPHLDDCENQLRQASLDHTDPPVSHSVERMTVLDATGTPAHILVFEVPPSEDLHRTRVGDVFLRVGNQTRKLTYHQTQELEFDKGKRNLDRTWVTDAAMSDLDEGRIDQFVSMHGPAEKTDQYLRARSFISPETNRVSHGAILLLGKHPQQWLPNAYIRVLRYEGNEALTGANQNAVLDQRIEGPLLHQIEETEKLLNVLLRTYSRLDSSSGRFIQRGEIPRFAWLEAVVNAVTHRSYSLQGDYIRVRLFDDRLVVESPGRLPGSVRIDNIRQTRFSRNPQVSRALSDFGVVQELNEGVNRMFDEMAAAGLPEPLLEQTESGFRVTLFSGRWPPDFIAELGSVLGPEMRKVVQALIRGERVTTAQIMAWSNLTAPTVRRRMRALERKGSLKRVGTSETDPTSYWELSPKA